MNYLKVSIERVTKKYKRRIRNKAIERARTRIYLHGNLPENYEQYMLEAIVKEEEDKLIGEYKARGLMVVMAAFGLSIFS